MAERKKLSKIRKPVKFQPNLKIVKEILSEDTARKWNWSPEQKEWLNALFLGSVSNDDTDHVKRLLNQGADIEAKDNKGMTALILSAQLNRIESCRLLLDKGAKIEAKDRNGQTALIRAAIAGHTEICELLIEKGANIEVSDDLGWTALRCAKLQGNTDTVKLLASSYLNKTFGEKKAEIFRSKFNECVKG